MPPADQSDASTGRVFTHDPYGPRVLLAESPRSVSPGPSTQSESAAPGTLHTPLQGHVNFSPYPTQGDTIRAFHPSLPKCEMTRLFVGQLPYGTTPEQLQWLIFEVTQVPVFFTENIHIWTGEQQSKGCVHTYCHPADVDHVIQKLHRHTLVDDSGIWIAETDEEYHALEAYCAAMKKDKTKRFFQRPCQPVVIQRATSTFVPRHTHGCAGGIEAVPPAYNRASVESPPPYSALGQHYHE